MNEHIAKGPAPKLHEEAEACLNTDRALWRERKGDYYADSIHVTESGAIGINCGGTVIVKPIRAWFALGKESNEKLDLQMAYSPPAPTSEASTLQGERSENGERTGALATSVPSGNAANPPPGKQSSASPTSGLLIGLRREE